MLLKEGVALEAPNTTRYRNFFEDLKAGDLVLHYLTTTLTRQKEKRSSVVGASKVVSNPAVIGRKIVARCSGTVEFPKPIHYSELRRTVRKSEKFEKLLRVGMQRYLTKLSRPDFESILGTYPSNKKRFSKSLLARQLRGTLIK